MSGLSYGVLDVRIDRSNSIEGQKKEFVLFQFEYEYFILFFSFLIERTKICIRRRRTFFLTGRRIKSFRE